MTDDTPSDIDLGDGVMLRWIDGDNPKGPFERKILEAAEHAEEHLLDGYKTCMECGLNNSAAESTGVFIAIQRLLARHLIQHCTNSLLSKEHAIGELASVESNVKRLIEEHYDAALVNSLEYASKQGTKQ